MRRTDRMECTNNWRMVLILGLLAGDPHAEAQQSPARPSDQDPKCIPTKRIDSVAISPDGSRIACGGGDGSLVVYDDVGRKRWSSRASGVPIYSIAIDADGSQIASAGPQRLALKFHDDGPEIDPDRIEFDLTRPMTGSPTRGLASVPIGGRIEVRYLASGHVLRTLDSFNSPIDWIAIPDRKPLLLSFDQTLKARLINSGSMLAESPRPGMRRGEGRSSGGSTAASRSGTRLASVVRDKNEPPGITTTVKLWDVDGDRYRVIATTGVAPNPCAVALTPDGKLFATALNNEAITIWDFDKGKVVQEFRSKATAVRGVDLLVYRPDGSRIASGDRNGVVRILDAASGRIIREHPGFGGPVRAIAFLPSRIRVVSGGYNAPGKRGPAMDGADATPLMIFDFVE